MSVLESNLCEESVAEYSVTTVSGDVLRSSAGYVHLVQEVWGPLQQEVWGPLQLQEVLGPQVLLQEVWGP